MTDDEVRSMKEYWEAHARNDPLWAVLSDPAKDGRRWDSLSFFETGRREISVLFYQLDALGIGCGSASALDFGCGVGRLSQALARRFDRVVGVDISPAMIRLAERFNAAPDRVRYAVNEYEHLKAFPEGDFDFIYSNIVLQHIRPEITLKYLEEFVRLLAPGGLLVFQLPSHLKSSDEAAVPDGPALAAEAYSARIRLVEPVPQPAKPASSFVLGLEVENAGPLSWKQNRATIIRVGNHWYGPDGETMLVQDDGRADLPPAMAPGERGLVYLACRAPSEVGRYICEIDLVHESIAWFKDRGSAPLRFEVTVGDEGSGSGGHAGGFDADNDASGWKDRIKDIPLDEFLDSYQRLEPFPMHGIPKDRVVEFFLARACRVERIEEDAHGGPEWTGYRYFVRKS